jgi:hypothetical protein
MRKALFLREVKVGVMCKQLRDANDWQMKRLRLAANTVVDSMTRTKRTIQLSEEAAAV